MHRSGRIFTSGCAFCAIIFGTPPFEHSLLFFENQIRLPVNSKRFASSKIKPLREITNIMSNHAASYKTFVGISILETPATAIFPKRVRMPKIFGIIALSSFMMLAFASSSFAQGVNVYTFA